MLPLRRRLPLLAALTLGLSFACTPLYEGGRPAGEDAKTLDAPDAADEILFVDEILDSRGVQQGREAIVLRDGRILDVTSRAAALQYRGVGTRVTEFPGARALPGLCDAHGHLAGLGKSLETVQLRGCRSFEEVVERCAAMAEKLPPGAWLEGRGWDQNLWSDTSMPVHDALSRRFPGRPVWLRRVDGHAGIANEEALRRAGITESVPDPAGGRILHHPDGRPTGVLVDNAMAMIERQLPRVDARALERRLLLAQEHCLALGLTRVHDAGVSLLVRRLLRKLEADGAWKLGVYGMWTAPGRGRAPQAPDDEGPRARLRFRAVKLYIDGALGSRGAALLQPYSDEPEHRGLVTLEDDELRRILRACAASGLQPCVHAIGDRGNRLVLDAYAEVLDDAARRRLRPRIEHAQVLAKSDVPRFAELGVLASMQPTHLTTDMAWAPVRLGPERVRFAYAFRTLRDSGARVAFGSDFPVEPASPFEGLFAAVTTRPPDAPESDPFRPDQRLSRRAALAGFTMDAAYAAHEEEVRGQIAPGFEGDLTIVDRNVFEGPAAALLGTRVMATYVGGERVFGKENGE